MAESAPQLDDDQIYDQPGNAPSNPAPSLKALEGGGETTEPKNGHLKEVDKQPSREDLSDAEEKSPPKQNSYTNQLGSGYKPGSKPPSIRSRLTAGGNRKFLIGGGVAALLAGVSIAIFLTLLPLKILHIVNNLQSHFYASAENATQRETNKLFSDYIKRSLKTCGGTIDKNCNPFPVTTNPVIRLYRGWRTARFEDKLASSYGIEFKKVGPNYYMKAPGLTGNGGDITSFVNDNTGETLDEFIAKQSSGEWSSVNRSQIRQSVNDALAGGSRWKEVMYRYKVGRFLEEKYGIKRCIIFCSGRDALADNIQAQKTAAKLYLVERVIQPRDESLAIVLKCFFDPSCDPTKTEPISTEAAPCQVDINCELDGEAENIKTDTAIRTNLEDLASSYGIRDASELTAMYQDIESQGFDKFVIKYVMDKVFNVEISDASAETLSKAVPLIGWVNMAFQLVHFSDQAPSKLKKLSYLTNAAAVVSLYAMYRTYADEMKTGKVNATEVGSMVDSLGPIAKNANLSDLKGGNAEAEQTPLYDSLINGGSGSGASSYTCDNGKPPAGGSGTNLTCPEEKLAVDSSFFNSLKSFVDSTGLTTIANIWNGTIGSILHFLGSIIGWITSPILGLADKACLAPSFLQGPFQAYCSARSAIAALTQKIISFATSELFPSPISENMSGGRTFDVMSAGADVSGNDFAHNGLGGQALTNGQVAVIRTEQQKADLQSYQNESVFARLFDTNSSYSPITKLAMAMPASLSDFQTNLGSFFARPFSIFNHVGVALNPARAFAASDNQPDPFGVTQYGYPENDPQVTDFFQQDQSTYWDQHCANNSLTDQWNQDAASTIDPNTGMPMNTTFNGCELIQAATSSDGGLFDSSLLSQDDLGGQ